jgi:hypothetical protein
MPWRLVQAGAPVLDLAAIFVQAQAGQAAAITEL